MARQETLKHKKYFLCPLASSLPALCIVYLHYAWTKSPPSVEIPAQP